MIIEWIDSSSRVMYRSCHSTSFYRRRDLGFPRESNRKRNGKCSVESDSENNEEIHFSFVALLRNGTTRDTDPSIHAEVNVVAWIVYHESKSNFSNTFSLLNNSIFRISPVYSTNTQYIYSNFYINNIIELITMNIERIRAPVIDHRT